MRPFRRRSEWGIRPPFVIVVLLIILIGNGVGCGKKDPRLEKKFVRAMALYNRQETKTAFKLFEEILEEEPGNINARFMKGKVLYYHSEIEKARVEFETVLNEDESHTGARFYLAGIQSLKKETQDEALKNLDRLLARSGDHIEAWHLKGVIHEKRKELDKAIPAYRAAVFLAQKAAYSRIRLGALYARAGMKEKAESEFRGAACLGGGSREVQEEIARARKALKGK